MPTYDYICDDCGHEFEAYESITAQPRNRIAPNAIIPSCAGRSGPGAAILFKGSGFYQTDYRSESYKKAAQAEKPASDGPPKSSGDSAASPSSTSPRPPNRRSPPQPAPRASHDPRTMSNLLRPLSRSPTIGDLPSFPFCLRAVPPDRPRAAGSMGIT